jgi:hypothetical protein
MITHEQLQEVLQNKNIPAAAARHINSILKDKESIEHFRNNLASYRGVLTDGKYKVSDYMNAVMYVGFKMMDMSNIDAYARVFPERIERMYKEGKTLKDIHAYVHAFHKTKLVVNIISQARIPGHLMFMDIYQEAIYKNLELMRNPKVRYDTQQKAAQFLAEHLAMPEDTNIKLDIGIDNSAYMKGMQDVISELGKAQQKALENGSMSLKDIAASKIVSTVEED